MLVVWVITVRRIKLWQLILFKHNTFQCLIFQKYHLSIALVFNTERAIFCIKSTIYKRI